MYRRFLDSEFLWRIFLRFIGAIGNFHGRCQIRKHLLIGKSDDFFFFTRQSLHRVFVVLYFFSFAFADTGPVLVRSHHRKKKGSLYFSCLNRLLSRNALLVSKSKKVMQVFTAALANIFNFSFVFRDKY